MKTITLSPVITPGVIIGAILIVAIAVLANAQQRISLVSNLKVDLIIVLILGMMMCTTGIGRVAAVNQWLNPLSILGMLVGVAILLVLASSLFGFKLPLIPTDYRVLYLLVGLIGSKILISVIHSLFIKG